MAKTASPREFIETWQSSSSLEEVATKLNMRKRTASTRASYYRTQKKVPLKKFPASGRPSPDWNELAEFARSLGEE